MGLKWFLFLRFKIIKNIKRVVVVKILFKLDIFKSLVGVVWWMLLNINFFIGILIFFCKNIVKIGYIFMLIKWIELFNMIVC